MKFIRQDQSHAARAIAASLMTALSRDQRVLWLVSGGSNIQVQIAVIDELRQKCPDTLARLAVVPMDERYGPDRHDDSNFEQMHRAGFDPGTANWIDILAHDQSCEATADSYDALLKLLIEKASVVFATFGIGANKHTAGIQPNSDATKDTERMVIGYKGPDYTRLTMTRRAMKHIDTAYVMAYGDNKVDALDALQKNSESVADAPELMLYDVATCYVYNDRIESE